MTRAQKELSIITYRTKNNEKLEKSIFFTELENIQNYRLNKNRGMNAVSREYTGDNLPGISTRVNDTLFFEGSTVTHKKFGIGEVVRIDNVDNIVEVNFMFAGTKRLALDVVNRGKLLKIMTE